MIHINTHLNYISISLSFSLFTYIYIYSYLRKLICNKFKEKMHKTKIYNLIISVILFPMFGVPRSRNKFNFPRHDAQRRPVIKPHVESKRFPINCARHLPPSRADDGYLFCGRVIRRVLYAARGIFKFAHTVSAFQQCQPLWLAN